MFQMKQNNPPAPKVPQCQTKLQTNQHNELGNGPDTVN